MLCVKDSLNRYKVTRNPQNNLTFGVICIIHRTQNYTLDRFSFKIGKKRLCVSVSVCVCMCQCVCVGVCVRVCLSE